MHMYRKKPVEIEAPSTPFNLLEFRRRVLICRDNVLGRSAKMPVGAYVAVSVEDYEGYDSALQPQQKFIHGKLNDAGIAHLMLLNVPVSPSSDLSPGQCEYRVIERESSHA